MNDIMNINTDNYAVMAKAMALLAKTKNLLQKQLYFLDLGYGINLLWDKPRLMVKLLM